MKIKRLIAGLVVVASAFASFGAAPNGFTDDFDAGIARAKERTSSRPDANSKPQRVCAKSAILSMAANAAGLVTDCYWHWMNGNISKEGITADLEYLKAGGVDAAMIFDVGVGVERGMVDYGSREWKDCVKWACQEAERLGMELSLHNSPGYSAMGGPWITPEESMKELTWAVDRLPPHKCGYYREIAVLPLSTADETIEIGRRLEAGESLTIPLDGEKEVVAINIWRGEREKPLDPFDGPRDYAPRVTITGMGTIAMPVLRARDVPGRLVLKKPVKAKEITLTVSRGANLARMEVISSTPATGRVLHLGYTTTGQCVTAAPDAGRGLECDKFSRIGVDAHFAKFLDPLLDELKPWCGTTLKNIVMDSWEAGRQDWSKDFPREFMARRGYDIEPWLKCLTGREVRGRQWTLRFLMDYEMTKQELFIDNFIMPFKEHLAKYNLQYAGEPYGDGDFTTETLAPLIDLPMSEFWARSHYGTVERVKRVNNASPAARVHGCEFATAYPGDADIEPTLANFKDDIDVLMASGVNRFVFHCVAHQPDDTSRLTMGPFGTRFDRAHCQVQNLREIADYIKSRLASAHCGVEHVEIGGREAWLARPTGETRAVFMAHRNMTEEVLLVHPQFVAACERLGLARMYVAEGDYMWKADASAGGDGKGTAPTQETFEKMMAAFGLADKPVIPFGHSAQATFPWNFAAWNPARTLCIISFHGDAPRTNLTGYGRENVEWGRTRSIDGIPALMIEGEYEWWEARVRPALAFRMMYPESCISFLCDAGRGHFDLADETVDYIVRFIEKSLAARPNMEKVDSAAGWLAARWSAGEASRPVPAPCAEYAGDRHDAFWYFDGEMAALTEARYAATLGKKMQFLGIRHGGKVLHFDAKSHVKIRAPLVCDEDGIFTVEAFFTDDGHETPSAAHSASSPIIKYVSGPAKPLGNGRFRLDRSRLGPKDAPRARWDGVTLCAEAPGDGIYKSAVQEVMLTLPQPMIGSPL